MNKQEKVQFVIDTLNTIYPEIPIPLDHKDPYTLLIAVLLSAQSTDVRVNQITPLLADTNKEVINAFGVWGPKKFMGREYDGIHRKTFLINEDGVVDRVIDKVKTKAHAAQILES